MQTLTAEDWAGVLEYHDRNTPNPYNIMFVEPYGGVINTVPDGFNAFVHRSAYMDLYIDSFWQQGTDFTGFPAAQKFLEGYMAILNQYANDEHYQNYPHRDYPDYRWAYWADAYNSLLFVKQKYDPTGVFTFEQAITPYPADPGIHRSTVPSRFSDPTITYDPWSRAGAFEPHTG